MSVLYPERQGLEELQHSFKPCLLVYEHNKKSLSQGEAWPLKALGFVVVVGCSENACHEQCKYNCNNPECQ
jgi:hypothetical protein